MRALALSVLPLLFLACMGSDEPAPDIRPGLYQYSENFVYNNSLYTLMEQTRFNPDHTHFREGFLNDVKTAESKGTWEVSMPVLTTRKILTRYATAPGDFGPWEPRPDHLSSIQNITGSSFQLLMRPGDIPQGVVGVESGWKTYNRIGD